MSKARQLPDGRSVTTQQAPDGTWSVCIAGLPDETGFTAKNVESAADAVVSQAVGGATGRWVFRSEECVAAMEEARTAVFAAIAALQGSEAAQAPAANSSDAKFVARAVRDLARVADDLRADSAGLPAYRQK